MELLICLDEIKLNLNRTPVHFTYLNTRRAEYQGTERVEAKLRVGIKREIVTHTHSHTHSEQ